MCLIFLKHLKHFDYHSTYTGVCREVLSVCHAFIVDSLPLTRSKKINSIITSHLITKKI